jgi:hypothetical protein
MMEYIDDCENEHDVVHGPDDASWPLKEFYSRYYRDDLETFHERYPGSLVRVQNKAQVSQSDRAFPPRPFRI